ncbi:Zinc finger BED domain containing protein 1 [Dissostichus eleginoides]|uniref:Zinc finger BED domain containing protein 1 n=1 Tax=Dissostichus eleginoides TaxID=100907 RepID=A0AAD9C8Q6_DISEL|nr:Zinc finger BED domain containing protein 1 [Dissostichus eleginoides]
MVLCAQQLSQNPSWGNVQGIRCAGHTLQLCINAAVKLDPICRVIAAARRLVGHFKKSAKATSALTLKQKQQNVAEHKLIQDVSTRWNSTYSMLERLLEHRCPVTAVLSEPGTTHRSDRDLDLTTAQWRIAEDIVSVLRPMITLTELLSQDVNVSLSATLPMLVNMKRRHLLSRDDDSTTVKAVKKKITEEIDKRWELTGSLEGSIYIQAAVLDPMQRNGTTHTQRCRIWLRVYLQQKKLLLRERTAAAQRKVSPHQRGKGQSSRTYQC